MSNYEMLYIINNEISEESKKAVIEKINAIVTKNGGEIANVDEWGTRKFAYPINYKTEGYYVLVNFSADASVPEEINRNIRIMDETVRCMILKK